MYVNVGFLFTNVWTERPLQPGNIKTSLIYAGNLENSRAVGKNRCTKKEVLKKVFRRYEKVESQLNYSLISLVRLLGQPKRRKSWRLDVSIKKISKMVVDSMFSGLVKEGKGMVSGICPPCVPILRSIFPPAPTELTHQPWAGHWERLKEGHNQLEFL